MRETITTQEQLLEHGNTKKIWLVEPEPAMVLTGWQPGPSYTTTSPYEGLVKNPDLVRLSGYRTGTVPGAATIGAAGAASYLGACPSSAVFAEGCAVRYFRVHTFSKPANLASFRIHIWRWAAASGAARVLTCVYDQECLAQLSDYPGWHLIAVTAPGYTAQLGDIPGISFTWSGGSPVNFMALADCADNGGPFAAYPITVKAAGVATTGTYDWGTGATTLQQLLLPVILAGDAPELVHIGDSITEGGYTPGHIIGMDPGFFYGFAWTGKIGINGAYNSEHTAAHAVAGNFNWGWANSGIFGQTMQDVAGRFDTDVRALKPKVCIISLSSNDVSGGVPQATTLYFLREMLGKCELDGILPIVTAVLPLEAPLYTAGWEATAVLLRSAIRAVVAEYLAARYIDSRGALTGVDLLTGYTVDGVHLTAEAQQVWGADMTAQMVATSDTSGCWYTPWQGGRYSDFDFVSLRQNSELLPRQADLASCVALAGSCYFDMETSRLYVRCFGDADPQACEMVINFRQYFAKGASPVLTPDDSPYPVQFHALIKAVPGFTQYVPDALFGGALVQIGSVLVNDAASVAGSTDGPFSACLREYIYYNQRISCRMGGEDLPYSAYSLYWVGIMQSPEMAAGVAELPVRDLGVLLEKKLPETLFTLAEYPGIEAAAIGKSIPLAYGPIKNVRPTLIDFDTRQYKLCGHKVFAITALRWNGRVVTYNIINADLALAQFSLSAQTDGVTTADFTGYTTPGGVTPATYGAIALCLLRNRLADTDLDLASFAAVEALRPQAVGLWVEGQEKIGELLTRLDESCLCFHGQTRSGKVFVRALNFTGFETEVEVSTILIGSRYYWYLAGHGFADLQQISLRNFTQYVPDGRYFVRVVTADAFMVCRTASPYSEIRPLEANNAGQYVVGCVVAQFVAGVTAHQITETIDYSKIYKKISIGYGKNCTVQPDTYAGAVVAIPETEPLIETLDPRQDYSWEYKYEQAVSAIAGSRYDCQDTLVLATLLADAEGAAEIAEQRRVLHEYPLVQVRFICGLLAYQLLLGDFIAVLGCRYLPDGTAYMIIKIEEDPATSKCTINAIAPSGGALG